MTPVCPLARQHSASSEVLKAHSAPLLIQRPFRSTQRDASPRHKLVMKSTVENDGGGGGGGGDLALSWLGGRSRIMLKLSPSPT